MFEEKHCSSEFLNNTCHEMTLDQSGTGVQQPTSEKVKEKLKWNIEK